MATTWIYGRCGHTRRDEKQGPDDACTLDGSCLDCREARIGEVIRFVRFGEVPTSGRSVNHRERSREDGVSVYEVVRGKADLVGWYFDFLDRPAYRGTGEVVGWGSDGEPLVRVITVRRIGRKVVNALVGQSDLG